MLSPRTLTKNTTRVSLRWMDALRINSISSPSVTADYSLRKCQQPGAHLQSGPFRGFQVDFEARIVAPAVTASFAPMLLRTRARKARSSLPPAKLVAGTSIVSRALQTPPLGHMHATRQRRAGG